METKKANSPIPPFRGIPRGAEFARYLVEKAGLDSVRIKSQIEEACIRDLSTYFEDRSVRFSVDWLKSLVKAELAGGSFAATNIPERLQRQLTDMSNDEIAGIAADISILLSEKRSDFNYLRYSLNAVSTVMGDLFKDNLFDIPGLSKKEKDLLENNLKDILEVKLTDARTLTTWLDEVTTLHYKVIDLLESLTELDKKRSSETRTDKEFLSEAKKNKQHVSTKSLSTYKLRVDDYAITQSQSFLKEYKNMKKNMEFDTRMTPYEQYVGMTKQEIKSKLKENINSDQLKEKYLVGLAPSKGEKSDEIVSIKENISSKKIMDISYSGDGVSLRLIRPILNSLRSQLLLNPNQKQWRSEARSGGEFLSVAIDALISEDLPKIEKILQLHAK